jgi:hypothetical protein
MFLFFHDSNFTHPTFSSSANNFAHAQTLSRMSSLSGRMNIERVNIEFFPRWKKIKQWRISFVLCYLRMILWKISTAISIKHRILATFNKKQSILTACMPLTDMEHNILLKICLTIPKEAIKSRISKKDGKHNDKRNKRTIRKTMI